MEGAGDDAGVVAVELAGLGSVGMGGWDVDGRCSFGASSISCVGTKANFGFGSTGNSKVYMNILFEKIIKARGTDFLEPF